MEESEYIEPIHIGIRKYRAEAEICVYDDFEGFVISPFPIIFDSEYTSMSKWTKTVPIKYADHTTLISFCIIKASKAINRKKILTDAYFAHYIKWAIREFEKGRPVLLEIYQKHGAIGTKGLARKLYHIFSRYRVPINDHLYPVQDSIGLYAVIVF